MSIISCLVYDDKPDEAERVAYSLIHNWNKIRSAHHHVPELDCNTITDDKAVRDMFRLPGRSIQLFVCDVLIDRDGRPEMHGLLLIQEAKKAPPIPVVVAVSKGPDERHAGDFYGKIRDSGTDLFFEKKPLHEAKAGLEITESILQCLESRGLLLYRGELLKEIGHENNAALAAAFNKIGDSNLSAIANYYGLNTTAEKVYISTLKRGLSGADVLIARYSSATIDLSRNGVLLKISRDYDSLSHEFENYRREVSAQQIISSQLIVEFLPIKQPYVVNGWCALGGRFEHAACTMLKWLTESNRKIADVESLLIDLFQDDGLAQTYAATRKVAEGDAISITRKYLFTEHRSVSVQSALEELGPLITKYSTDSKLETISKFIFEGEIGGVMKSRLSKKMQLSVQHGDLHGGNAIVVTTGRKHRPKIIDYANIAILPWATDIVRFSVDVALSCIDVGVPSYEWENLDRWVPVAQVLALEGPSSMAQPLQTDQPACWHAITWMSRNVFKIADLTENGQHKAEYLIALGIEFLRASYRKEELPAPKRAFGLIAAEIALRCAERELLGLL